MRNWGILYDPAVTSEFVQFQKDRVKVGEIKSYRPYLLASEQLNKVYMTGMISVPQLVHGTKYTLNEKNGKLLDVFWNGNNMAAILGTMRSGLFGNSFFIFSKTDMRAFWTLQLRKQGTSCFKRQQK